MSWIIWTDQFIESIFYKEWSGEAYENFWPLYFILGILHLLSLISFIALSIYKIKVLNGLYRLRYMYIALWYILMIACQIIFLSILPSFDIWLMQKEQIIFFAPFLIGLIYSMYRYKFWYISLSLWKLWILVFSLWFSLFSFLAIKNILILMDSRFITFWWLDKWISLWDIIIVNIFFYFTYKYLENQFNIHYDTSFKKQKKLSKIQTQIPFLKNVEELNSFLLDRFKKELSIAYVEVITWKQLDEVTQLSGYFRRDHAETFINDRVFIEENRHKFDKDKIIDELNPEIQIYIPIYRKIGQIEWILGVWKKTLWDYYGAHEIDMLVNFSDMLTGHLKYINIYNQVHQMTLTLDKKVDEQTIEYNNLINKQKEFIAYIWHEIKNPITNTIFISHELREKIETIFAREDPEDVREDVSILCDELRKISDLSKTIFSSHRMELWKTKLYLSSVNICEFIQNEVYGITCANPNVNFDIELKDIGYKDIDEVQFRQVLQNLLWNAIKFTPENRGVIRIRLSVSKTWVAKISIEDNGKGFTGMNISNIFDKYSTWNQDGIWLGMWLYLCKRIVELHAWKISSAHSKYLGWAKFTITLP
jgi:signal transduction histidine kinase